VPILSREAINHPSEPAHNFAALSASSPCDDLLLEFTLGLELRERNLITFVFPVMIGDKSAGQRSDEVNYGGYFSQGCHPNCDSSVVVSAVVDSVTTQLENIGLETIPVLESHSAGDTLATITSNQGHQVMGLQSTVPGSTSDVFTEVIEKIVQMSRNSPTAYDVFISYRVGSDTHHAQQVYDLLTKCGVKVWWDRKCLKDGVNW